MLSLAKSYYRMHAIKDIMTSEIPWQVCIMQNCIHTWSMAYNFVGRGGGWWGKLNCFKLQRSVRRLMTLVGRVNWCSELFKTFSRPNTIFLNFGNRT